MIKPFVGENFSVFQVLYALKIELKLVVPRRMFSLYKSWLSPNLSEMNWFDFLMTVASMSSSLTTTGSKQDMIILRLHFALLEANTGNASHNCYKCSCNSVNCFFRIRKNWVEAKCTLSQSSTLASSRRLWSCLSFFQDAAQFNLYFCFNIRKQFFHLSFFL